MRQSPSPGQYPKNWLEISQGYKATHHWRCQACGTPHGPVPFVLTVHHLDFNPANCDEQNLVALCQRCHLRLQQRHPHPLTKAIALKLLTPMGNQLPLLL